MFNVGRITLVLILSFYSVITCSRPINNTYIEPPPPEHTPKENEEAELITLCLSGNLVAPDDLYNQALEDLVAIRSTFGAEFESIKHITFRTPWIVGSLIVGFNDATAQKVANGEYYAWDEPNKKYQVTKIDKGLVGSIGSVVLHFKGRLHPRRLAKLYAVLPGVRYAQPNVRIGDSPTIYPRKIESGITYLFRAAWGDCPSGCINSVYWYFVVEGDQPVFIGHWTPNEESQKPDWWDEANQNIEQYREW